MFDRQQLEELRHALERWEETTRQQAAARLGDRRSRFFTTSSTPVDELYTPPDIADLDYDRALGLPTSMRITPPAAFIWGMSPAAAEKQRVRPEQLRGTLQNDILKEYIAQKEFIFPPEPSMRLVVDTIEFRAQHMTKL